MSFSQLPAEVMEHILKGVDTTTLLCCRSVSHYWNNVATGLLKLRHTQLNPNWYKKENGMEIFQLFKGDCIPWSACVLPKELNVALRQEFISVYGHQILWCQIEDDNWNFSMVKMFALMPNLQHLSLPKFKILPPDIEEEIHALKFLKHIRLTFGRSSIINQQNLEFILKYTTNTLQIMRIHNLRLNRNTTGRLVHMLSNIPVLQLYITSFKGSSMGPFEQDKLNVKKLSIHSNLASIFSDRNFGKSLDQLEELKIGLWPHQPYTSVLTVQLPCLPNLTTISFYLAGWHNEVLRQPNVSFTMVFPKILLPSLALMKFSNSYGDKVEFTEFPSPIINTGVVLFYVTGKPKAPNSRTVVRMICLKLWIDDENYSIY